MVIDMNRQKHAMLYWGQEVLRVPSRGKDLLALNADTISYLNLPVDRAWLELRDLGSLTIEEASTVTQLMGMFSNDAIKNFETVNSCLHYWNHLSTPAAADFLRMAGFATPWIGNDITYLYNKGWIRARAGK